MVEQTIAELAPSIGTRAACVALGVRAPPTIGTIAGARRRREHLELRDHTRERSVQLNELKC